MAQARRPNKSITPLNKDVLDELGFILLDNDVNGVPIEDGIANDEPVASTLEVDSPAKINDDVNGSNGTPSNESSTAVIFDVPLDIPPSSVERSP